MKNEHKFTFENNVIQLLVTNGEPPKKRHPENCDILVHVKNEDEVINEDVLDKLDQATDIIRKKYSKNTDAELDTYKLRISRCSIYIRDETKDNLILGTVLYILDHVSDAVDKLLDEKTNNIEEKQENNDKKYPTEEESVEILLPEEKNHEPVEQKHQSRFNVSSINLEENNKSDGDAPSDMVDMLLNSRK